MGTASGNRTARAGVKEGRHACRKIPDTFRRQQRLPAFCFRTRTQQPFMLIAKFDRSYCLYLRTPIGKDLFFGACQVKTAKDGCGCPR